MKSFFCFKRFARYCSLCFSLLLFAAMTVYMLCSGSPSALAAQNMENSIPKAIKSDIEKKLGVVKYVSVKIDKSGKMILIVQKDENQYKVTIDKGGKILSILSVDKDQNDEPPEMGC